MGNQDFVNSYEGSVGKVIAQGMRVAKSADQTTLGTIRSLAAGREIVYAKVGASAISAAHVMNGPTATAGLSAIVVGATASVGAKVVNLYNTAAITKDQFKDGFLVVVSGTGIGYSYMVDYHLSAAATDLSININLKDGLETTLTTTSITALIPNKYNGIVACPADGAAPPVGVSLCTASAAYFVWLGKRGQFPVAVGSSGFTAGMPVVAGCAAGTVIGVGGESALDTSNRKVLGFGAMSAADNAGTVAMVDFTL